MEKEALLHTIILFIHSDLLKGKSLEAYIRESHNLPKIVDNCGGRYHSFNNEDRNNQRQVTKLLENINALRRQHGTRHYTPEMFKTTQTEITGKDRMNLPKFPYIFCVIVLIGVILLGTWQMKRVLEQKEEELQMKEQENQELTNELKQKKELQKKERENQELTNELEQKKEELQKKEQKNQQLIKELLPQQEVQLPKEVPQSEQ